MTSSTCSVPRRLEVNVYSNSLRMILSLSLLPFFVVSAARLACESFVAKKFWRMTRKKANTTTAAKIQVDSHLYPTRSASE